MDPDIGIKRENQIFGAIYRQNRLRIRTDDRVGEGEATS
jgi:hypothetical protein